MRRPLTPNGVPFVQAAGALHPGDIIFDVTDLDPDYVWAVTLYCWVADIVAGGGYIPPVVAAGVAQNGDVGTTIPTAILSLAPAVNNFQNYQVNGNGPAKMMDRIPLRGQQQVVVATTAGNADVFWYGYFERVGVAPVPVPYRPLLPDGPSALVEPYNAPVIQTVVAPAGGAASSNVHQLDATSEQRLDYLWLDVAEALGTEGVPTEDGLVTLNLPGGVSMPLPAPVAANTQLGSPIRMFDGIPFRAPSSGDNLISVTNTADTTVSVISTVSGRFARA